MRASSSSPLFAAIALGFATPGNATVIDFDDGVAGGQVGTAYSDLGLTFSNTEYAVNFGHPGSSGDLGIIATGSVYFFGADDAISGTFSSLVHEISIHGIHVSEAGVRLEVYDAADVLIGFDEAWGYDNDFYDLSVSVPGISRFALYQPFTVGGVNDFGDGALFDSLSFTESNAVPEPATWGMMLIGFGAVGFAMRQLKPPKLAFRRTRSV